MPDQTISDLLHLGTEIRHRVDRGTYAMDFERALSVADGVPTKQDLHNRVIVSSPGNKGGGRIRLNQDVG